MGLMPDDLRQQWNDRRRRFLDILEEKEINEYGKANITKMMRSRRSYFSRSLDYDGIHGALGVFSKTEFARFCRSIGREYPEPKL